MYWSNRVSGVMARCSAYHSTPICHGTNMLTRPVPRMQTGVQPSPRAATQANPMRASRPCRR